MKNILTLVLSLLLFTGFCQDVKPVRAPIGKLPYPDVLQSYRGDSSLIEIYQDTVKFRTNQDAYSFNKELFVKGINIADGGTITIDSQSIVTLDTANILYKTTVDTVFGKKTFLNELIAKTTADYKIGLSSYTSGSSAHGVYSYTTGYRANGFTAEIYGKQAIAYYSYSTNCDTLLKLTKSGTKVFEVQNATSSVKLVSDKALFEFDKHLSTPEITKAYQTLTYASTVTMNTDIGANAKITLTGNCALTLSNLSNGDEGNIIVIQDGTGSRTITITPTPKVINAGAGAITLSTAASSIDILSYTYDGTNLYITYGKNYN